MTEIRLSPASLIAQRLPNALVSQFPDVDKHWLCMSWPDGLLQATLLTDEDVADWRVLHRVDD